MGSNVLVNGYHNDPSLQQYRNNKSNPWIVQKFGGTSVGKFANRIAEDIVRCGMQAYTHRT